MDTLIVHILRKDKSKIYCMLHLFIRNKGNTTLAVELLSWILYGKIKFKSKISTP
jgi:hypothetical protein